MRKNNETPSNQISTEFVYGNLAENIHLKIFF